MFAIRNLIQKSCYPLYVIGAMAIYFAVSSSLNQDEIKLKTLYFLIAAPVIALLWLQERYLPYRTEWQKSYNDEWSDLLQSLILFPVIIELALIVYKKVFMGFSLPWIHEAHPAIQLLLVLIISEWGYYWYHRISHRKKNLWKFHAVHHGAQRVYWMNSARFHVIDMLISAFIYILPLVLFGISKEVIIAFVLINSITGLLEHANIDFKAGWLNYFFNSAELHRWHHSVIGKECQTNFGKVLSIWDLVHGTFYLPKDKQVGVVGIGKQKTVPNDFLGQLNYPFKTSLKESILSANTTIKVGIAGTLLLFSSILLARDFKPVASCFEFSNNGGSLLLKFNPLDHYKRSISAIKMPYNCATSQTTRVLSGIDIVPWKDISKFQSYVQSSSTLTAMVDSIKNGSNVIIPKGYTAKQYLKEHPVSVYTKTLNVKLTKQFGHGFAGQFYREFLLQFSPNSAALNEIVTSLKNRRSMKSADAFNEIKNLSTNTVLLVSMGLDWSDEINDQTPDYIVKFLNKIKQTGITVQFLKRDPVGLLEDNAKKIIPQVEKTLASGKDVIILGMCKGMPEALAGVAASMKGRLTSDRSQLTFAGRGKVKGVIGLSPMMGGLYWADKRDQMEGIFDVIQTITGEIPNRTTEMFSDYLRALESITGERTANLFKEVTPNLPSDITYLGVTGILPNDGLLYVKNSMKPFVDINRRLNLASGANDGFLEYPRTYIPGTYSRRVYNVPMHGSHMLTDGAVNEFSLLKPENEEAFYYSLLKFILVKSKSN